MNRSKHLLSINCIQDNNIIHSNKTGMFPYLVPKTQLTGNIGGSLVLSDTGFDEAEEEFSLSLSSSIKNMFSLIAPISKSLKVDAEKGVSIPCWRTLSIFKSQWILLLQPNVFQIKHLIPICVHLFCAHN